MFAGVLVLRGDRDAPERRLHVRTGLASVQVAPVRVAAPHGVHLGEVGVVAPVARVDQRQEARAVRARFGAEDAARRAPPVAVRTGVLQGVGAQVVVGLVQFRDGGDRVVDQRDDVRERVAEETRDAQCHVDARPAELRTRNDREAGDAARRLVPLRAYADEGEHLGDVVALRAHRGRTPDGEADAARVLARVGQVAFEQRRGERGADLPGVAGRDRLRVDGVEVAAGRQHVDQPARR